MLLARKLKSRKSMKLVGYCILKIVRLVTQTLTTITMIKIGYLIIGNINIPEYFAGNPKPPATDRPLCVSFCQNFRHTYHNNPALLWA